MTKSGRRSNFNEAALPLLVAVRSGASLVEAARSVGVPVGTVHGWASRGRGDPAGPFGAFARELDASRRKQHVDLGDLPLTHAEAERIIVAAVRNGSLQAMRLWLELHPRDERPADDELSWMEGPN